MDAQRKLRFLLELAESLDIEIRSSPYSPSSNQHVGGAAVRLKGRDILFLDDRARPADQVNAVAAALKGREAIEQMFLPPEIRDTIETAAD